MNDFERIQEMCDAMERLRIELQNTLEDIEAAQAQTAPLLEQSNTALVKLLEESIATLPCNATPQSIRAAVERECARQEAVGEAMALLEGTGCPGEGECEGCLCPGRTEAE